VVVLATAFCKAFCNLDRIPPAIEQTVLAWRKLVPGALAITKKQKPRQFTPPTLLLYPV
jgi:hypothetical protein